MINRMKQLIKKITFLCPHCGGDVEAVAMSILEGKEVFDYTCKGCSYTERQVSLGEGEIPKYNEELLNKVDKAIKEFDIADAIETYED
jgi:transcription elongation factor Elf1